MKSTLDVYARPVSFEPGVEMENLQPPVVRCIRRRSGPRRWQPMTGSSRHPKAIRIRRPMVFPNNFRLLYLPVTSFNRFGRDTRDKRRLARARVSLQARERGF